MIDLDAANKLMRGLEFMNGPAAENLYHHLTTAIEQMRRGGDAFVVPSERHPYAWREAWQLYEGLRDRASTPPDPAVIAANNLIIATERDWNLYLVDRAKIVEYVRRGDIDEEAARYIGLRPGDLGSPVSNDPDAARWGGKRSDWAEIASRLSLAVTQWESMTRDEKREIPIRMAARRSDQATARLEQRMAEMESRGRAA